MKYAHKDRLITWRSSWKRFQRFYMTIGQTDNELLEIDRDRNAFHPIMYKKDLEERKAKWK